MLGGGLMEYKLNEVNDSLLSISLNDTTYTLKAASENDILSDTIYKNPEIPASFKNKKYKGVLDYVLKNMGKKLMKKALFDVDIETDQDGEVVFVTFNNVDTLNEDEISMREVLGFMPKWSPAIYKGKRVRSVKRVVLNICPN